MFFSPLVHEVLGNKCPRPLYAFTSCENRTQELYSKGTFSVQSQFCFCLLGFICVCLLFFENLKKDHMRTGLPSKTDFSMALQVSQKPTATSSRQAWLRLDHRKGAAGVTSSFWISSCLPHPTLHLLWEPTVPPTRGFSSFSSCT